jgi:hypothetical protein
MLCTAGVHGGNLGTNAKRAPAGNLRGERPSALFRCGILGVHAMVRKMLSRLSRFIAFRVDSVVAHGQAPFSNFMAGQHLLNEVERRNTCCAALIMAPHSGGARHGPTPNSDKRER